MEQSNAVNEEVYRLLREEVSEENQDNFLKVVTNHLQGVPEEYHLRFVKFIAKTVGEVKNITKDLYRLWLDALANEKHDRAILGNDY